MILLLPLEHKIHIFSPPCNILLLFIYKLVQQITGSLKGGEPYPPDKLLFTFWACLILKFLAWLFPELCSTAGSSNYLINIYQLKEHYLDYY